MKRHPALVRIEEHEVFPLIEATIPETELQTLGDRIRDVAQSHLQRAHQDPSVMGRVLADFKCDP